MRVDQHALSPPLAKLAGRIPPAPGWFRRALACAPQRSEVEVSGAHVEVLAWGPLGAPGILFVPGLYAHADWWSFICPLLATEFRVAAMSLSGMGRSGWRERYTFELYADEIIAAAEQAGLCQAARRPVCVGHSHGGQAVFYAACRRPGRLRGAIMVDTGFGVGVPGLRVGEAWRRPQDQTRQARVFSSLDEALACFRLVPSQPCRNLFILDHIARASLRPVSEAGRTGWTWRFDPALLHKISFEGARALPGAHQTPMAHIIGDRSSVMAHTGGDQAPFLRAFVRLIRIADSDHHVMVDQPIALAAAIRSVACRWWAAA